MQPISNLMSAYFAYNTRVGDVRGAEKDIQEYRQLAKTAETPEERQRYADAVRRLEKELLPKFKQELEQYGNQLGLKGDEIGDVLSPEKAKEKGVPIGYQQDGALFRLLDNQPGSKISHKV